LLGSECQTDSVLRESNVCKGLEPYLDKALFTWMEASARSCRVNQFLSVECVSRIWNPRLAMSEP